MNTDDRGRNLAETVRGPDGRSYPLHRGFPDSDHQVVSRQQVVEWESVAGRALADLQQANHEIERLRGFMPADRMIVYDRIHHGGT